MVLQGKTCQECLADIPDIALQVQESPLMFSQSQPGFWLHTALTEDPS